MPGVVAEEVRLLEGPNLYFTRPAVKVRLNLGPYAAVAPDRLAALARSLGMRSRVGEPESPQRDAFLARLVSHVIRSVTRAAGTRRVGIRVRAGSRPGELTVAAVWRRRGRARVLGEGLAPLLQRLLDGADPDVAITDLADEMAAAEPGEPAAVRVPRVPVVSITGTNGKTTTTRLVAHLCMAAGRTTAWSSTDGIVAMGQVVEPGDYSGPAGARGVLDTPGLEIGVLETARGGLLLKGMGVSSNDVSVVTNVSADHLGLQGIETLDQLAEVKAVVVTVTRPQGWVVLNGEDPRVWAMRTRTKARPWAFALDPGAPALREALNAGGRGMTILDGDITVLSAGGITDRIVALAEVPATLAGLSVHNSANVLAGTAAALALGLPREAIVTGLRTFVTDDVLNPGRMNIYTLPLHDGAASVILDLAHNEAGLDALLDVAAGLRLPGARVLLALGTAGDRTDEILTTLGEIAGRRADYVVIAHKEKYLRGRTTAEFDRLFAAGLARSGVAAAAAYPDERAAVAALAAIATDGDVIAVMTHEQRLDIVAWLEQRGGHADDANGIREKVVAAQGRHPHEAEFDRLWGLAGQARQEHAEALLAAAPDDPRVLFEVAGVHDAADAAEPAVRLYERALDHGLREPHRHRAQVQLASTLRNLGRLDEAGRLLARLRQERPESAAVTAFAALTALDAGSPGQAVADLIDALLARATDDDANLYRAALTRYAAAERGRGQVPPSRS